MVTREALEGPEDKKIQRQMLQRLHLSLVSTTCFCVTIYTFDSTVKHPGKMSAVQIQDKRTNARVSAEATAVQFHSQFPKIPKKGKKQHIFTFTP